MVFFYFNNNTSLFLRFLYNKDNNVLRSFNKYAKIYIMCRRKELDIGFLEDCKSDDVIPLFIMNKKFLSVYQITIPEKSIKLF